MHYRRCEVRRKLLREQGWINCLRSWIYDFFILKLLTGYGVKISRPLIASAIIISIFAFLFWLTNGIVKNVNGKMVAPDFVDYIYHSYHIHELRILKYSAESCGRTHSAGLSSC
ncbi:MAG: hypothetical protein MW690_001330 [Methanophagales archaeon]|nr:hypothetical protein [Methanophagales archaeon]